MTDEETVRDWAYRLVTETALLVGTLTIEDMAHLLREERGRAAAMAAKFEAQWGAEGRSAAAAGAAIILKHIKAGTMP